MKCKHCIKFHPSLIMSETDLIHVPRLLTCLPHGLPTQHFIKTRGCDISLVVNFCGIGPQRQQSSVSCCHTVRGSVVWCQRMCSQVSFFSGVHTCLWLLILFLLLGPKWVPLPWLLLSGERGKNIEKTRNYPQIPCGWFLSLSSGTSQEGVLGVFQLVCVCVLRSQVGVSFDHVKMTL